MRISSLYFLILCLYMAVCRLGAEDARILEIRRIYNDIAERVKQEREDNVVGGSTHEITYKNIIPGTGYQHRSVSFFHDDEQDFEGLPGDIKQILRKVTVQYNISAVQFHAEYLYSKDGELLFHYFKEEGLQGGEKRFYLYRGELIKVTINPLAETEDERYRKYEATENFSASILEEVEAIRQRASCYGKLFHLLIEYQQID
jgi:hypothetical protein